MSNFLAKELKGSRYRILGLVGQGQFGQVYCAIHRPTGHLVALKELDRERFPTHKFLRELRFLLSLQHPNIVNCRALEHTQTGRYLVMDYCEGGTLRSLMEEDVRLHPAQGLKLITDVLAGLDHAHSRGIIHCDIKPENILLTVEPSGWTAHISDFGIARLNQEIFKDGTGNTGSPAYMAPERFYGQYSQSSDLYAVGILLFELLAGYRPFSGPPAELMSAHLNQPVKLPDTIPPGLQTIILTALQKLPARRFRSALDMLTQIQAANESLKSELGEAWRCPTLLQLTVGLPISPLKPLRQEILQTEVKQLTVEGFQHSTPFGAADWRMEQPQLAQIAKDAEGERIYWASGCYVGCQFYPDGILQQGAGPEKVSVATVRLPDPVRQVMVRPQGCFVVTHRAIYRIPPVLFRPEVAHHGQKRLQHSGLESELPIQHQVPQLIAEFRQDFVAAIAPDGSWMATAIAERGSGNTRLSIWQLSRMQPIKLIYGCSPHPFQLMVLDSRHIAVFSYTVDAQSTICITGVLSEVFTRRGDRVGSLNLPVPLGGLIRSPVPYRLMAMESADSDTVLLIDLKPLRISRIGVGISPVLAEAASWGYILMDMNGQIVLLDRYGQPFGQIDGPANPTAIAIVDPYGLLISTWKDGQGSLYTLDLRQAELGFLF
ncbi:serine/threonine-protein kinase [Leptothermofonsia sp. ETS-13]|uniref:serine/threonine-protein kinase n=1 Tax=Leptothermofonsia sp. ETS-13 TaxID=3035696 RepID=UPI003B9F61B6